MMTEFEAKMVENKEYMAEKLGETMCDCIMNDGSKYSVDMGADLLDIAKNIEHESQYELMNDVLIAVTGSNLSDLLEIVRERDDRGYAWETLEWIKRNKE